MTIRRLMIVAAGLSALSLAALLPATVQRNCTDSESSQRDELCERKTLE